MEGGDISNDTPPRFLFVFEGLIGRLPEEHQRKERIYRRLSRWSKAVALWEMDEAGLMYLWDMSWRHNLQVDIVTFLPYHEALKEMLDEEGVPYGNLRHYVAPETLAMRLCYMPYVARIFYSEPPRRFMFGDRGVYMPDEAVFNPLG